MAGQNTVPRFVAKWYTATGSTTGTASTSRATPTSLLTLVTASAAGSRLDSFTALATVTNVAGIIMLWDQTGGAYTLVKEILVAGVTPSDVAIGATATYNFSDDPKHDFYVLQASHTLVVSTTQAEVWDCRVNVGDFTVES